MRFRTQYHSPKELQQVREETRTYFHDESLTVQSATEDADLNVLVRRFGLSETSIPSSFLDPQFFGNWSDSLGLQDALGAIREAQEQFMALPGRIRARFRNSVHELWAFVQDPENDEEAVRLGLIPGKVREAMAPQPVKEDAKPDTPALVNTPIS